MPLIPVKPDLERVEFEDGDWYELRTQLGWYYRNQLSDGAGISIHLPWSTVKDGEIRLAGSEHVPVTMDGMPDVQLNRLLVYVAAWSHREPITEKTIKRVPPAHAKRLLARIAQLEKEQDGPTEDSPLAVPSNGSSEAPSSKGETVSI